MRALALIALIELVLCTFVVGQQEGRMRPPENLRCDRNHLTSFTGEVTQYKRTENGVVIRMKTDEATKERFVLRGAETALESQFLLNAQPFQSQDWKKIERSTSEAQPGTRATVWVCQAPRSMVVDWNPKQ